MNKQLETTFVYYEQELKKFYFLLQDGEFNIRKRTEGNTRIFTENVNTRTMGKATATTIKEHCQYFLHLLPFHVIHSELA